MIKLVSIIALTVLASACSKKDSSGEKSTDQPPEPAYTEARSIALFGMVANIYEAAGTDCAKLVADLEKFTTDKADEIRAQNAWKAKLTPAEKIALDTKYGSELHLAKKMMTAAQACGDDAGLAAVLKRFPLE